MSRAAPFRFPRFVFARIGEEAPRGDLNGGVFLGNQPFVDEVKNLFGEKEGMQGIPRTQRYALRRPLSEFFEEGSGEAEGLMRAYRTYAYTLKEIGEHLGVHYATVSRRIKRAKNLAECEQHSGAKNET
jgi:hypothetical protein